jgi:hypothetical protein
MNCKSLFLLLLDLLLGLLRFRFSLNLSPRLFGLLAVRFVTVAEGDSRAFLSVSELLPAPTPQQ